MNFALLSLFGVILFLSYLQFKKLQDTKYSVSVNSSFIVSVDPEDYLIKSNKNQTELTQYSGELCNRKCGLDKESKICYFKFVLEHYHAMGAACKRCTDGYIFDCFHPQCITADGIERGVMSINRQIPGPPIHVCQEDLIIVDVTNTMDGTSSTIHWHGIHQKETPYMDGVPFVTQCPINFATTFRYIFRASEPGTHFYHSHSGHQKANGIYGGLIVRQMPENDPNFALQDHDLPEHLIIMSDWLHETAEMLVPGLPSRFLSEPSSILINGKGRVYDKQKDEFTKTPLKEFIVEPNKRYRFRLVNSASHTCTLKFQIENHTLLLIATDSYNVRPTPVDTLFSSSGERYDFILPTNKEPGNYWIRVRAIGNCIQHRLEQFAILKYQSSRTVKTNVERQVPKYEEEFQSLWSLNHPNATCFLVTNDRCISHLTSQDTDEELLYKTPDHKFYLGFHNYKVPNEIVFNPDDPILHFQNGEKNMTLIGAINKITMKFPSSPLLSQYEELKSIKFCNDTAMPKVCKNKFICSCVHLIRVDLNSIVELIIVDETDAIGNISHPFHFHGHKMMVIEMGQHPFGIPMTVLIAKELDNANKLRKKPFIEKHNLRPPFKDTVSIPSRGFVIVRFRANNPGFWLMHCHYEWHLQTGMATIFQVGRLEQMKKVPNDFPKCGNFIPKINDNVIYSIK